MIRNVLAIFVGGGVGACLRYLTGYYFMEKFSFNFPVVTLAINVIGCFILGFLFMIFLNKIEVTPAVKLMLTVGFCGGFSTYTAFSLEVFELFRTAQYLYAGLYITLTFVLGIIAVWLGVNFARLF